MESAQHRRRDSEDEDRGVHHTEICLTDLDPQISRDGLMQGFGSRHGYRRLFWMMTAIVRTPATTLRPAKPIMNRPRGSRNKTETRSRLIRNIIPPTTKGS